MNKYIVRFILSPILFSYSPDDSGNNNSYAKSSETEDTVSCKEKQLRAIVAYTNGEWKSRILKECFITGISPSPDGEIGKGNLATFLGTIPENKRSLSENLYRR